MTQEKKRDDTRDETRDDTGMTRDEARDVTGDDIWDDNDVTTQNVMLHIVFHFLLSANLWKQQFSIKIIYVTLGDVLLRHMS